MANVQGAVAEGPSLQVPSYMPSDAIVVTDYRSVFEVLRSPKMRPEPAIENEPISGGVLTTTYGAVHTQRRRIMNRLVRPAALDHYRDVLLIPGMKRKLRDLADHPAADGTFRTDLVQFTMLPFVLFAAALVGFDMSRSGRDEELLQLINTMGDHHRVKWFTDDHCPYIERGRAAKAEFRGEYFDPAIARCPYGPGSEVPRDQHDLISLLAAEIDPHWHDRDLALREAFTSVFAAGVGSSATMMTNALEELSTWLPAHPEERERLQDLRFLSAVLQETLRLHPTPPALGRVALEDMVLSNGQEVKAGQWVAALPTPANRDPEVYGKDADEFNPDREVPSGVPLYGLSFGAGSHQCLGLRVVLGNDGVGSHAHVLRLLLAAGVQRDPEHPPEREPSERMNWARYPVIFTSLKRVLSDSEGQEQ